MTVPSRVFLAALLCIHFLTGCTTEPSTRQEPGTVKVTDPNLLVGHTWLLQGPNNVILVPRARPDLVFNDTTRINASSGCNSSFGQVELDDAGNFELAGPMGTTMMACPPPLDEQEQNYFEALGRARYFEIKDEQLLLQDEFGNLLLRFSKAK